VAVGPLRALIPDPHSVVLDVRVLLGDEMVTLNAQGVIEYLLEDLGDEIAIETQLSPQRDACGQEGLLTILIAHEVGLRLLCPDDVLDYFAPPSERLEQRPIDLVQLLAQFVK
jgi:hypothetical protein